VVFQFPHTDELANRLGKKEPPSVRFASRTLLIASDGACNVYLVSLDASQGSATGTILCAAKLSAPAVVVDAQISRNAGEKNCSAIFSWSETKEVAPSGPLAARPAPPQPRFFLSVCKFDGSHGTWEMATQRTVSSSSFPSFVRFVDESLSSIVALASAPFEVGESEPQPESALPKPVLPYSWNQTAEDVTLAFRLPTHSQSAHVSVLFAHDEIAISIGGKEMLQSQLYAPVKPADCIWTLTEGSLLTCYLGKETEGHRWPHIFHVDDGVDEALDPSEVAEFASRLTRFDQAPGSTRGNRSDPADDEDEELSGSEDSIVMSTVPRESGTPISVTAAPAHRYFGLAFTPSAPPGDSRMVVGLSHDVDVLAYQIGAGSDRTPQHVTTFPALSYVRASKRDARWCGMDAQLKYGLLVDSNR
jgi:hypothetical protein